MTLSVRFDANAFSPVSVTTHSMVPMRTLPASRILGLSSPNAFPSSAVPSPANASAGSHPVPSTTHFERSPKPITAQLRVTRTFSAWTPSRTSTIGPVAMTSSPSSSSSVIFSHDASRATCDAAHARAYATPVCTVGVAADGTTVIGTPPRTCDSNHASGA